jgi:lauroyl/myristoyl acyltransferase
MKLTLIRLFQKTPGFRSVAVRVHPFWYFRITLWIVTVARWLSPHTMRRARVFHNVLRGRFDEKELSVRTRRYLYHVRLFRDLEITWINWANRNGDWITIEGELHLRSALRHGKGVVLISPHNYGLSKIVAPVLAARGYRIHRGGNGGKKVMYRMTRWGTNGEIGWKYINYKGDYWHRVQSLKAIQNALAANDIVHVSPRAYLQGDAEMAIEFFGRKYYLDAKWFRIFRTCQAQVLPCFALGNTDGQIKIAIHSPLPVTSKSIAEEFAEIQAHYITQFPECGRLWKSVYVERGKW